MGRILILLSVLLIAVNAQCLALCVVMPCDDAVQHSAPAPEHPCHEVPPADTPDAPCAHPVFLSDDHAGTTFPLLVDAFLTVPLERVELTLPIRFTEPPVTALHTRPPRPTSLIALRI